MEQKCFLQHRMRRIWTSAPQKIPGFKSDEGISLSVSSHVLNEGVIKTRHRQGRGPRAQTSGSSWALQCWSWVNQETGRSESVSRASCQHPWKRSIWRKLQTQWDRTLNTAFHYSFCIHLHLDRAECHFSESPQHVEQWSLHSHACPWGLQEGKEGLWLAELALADDRQQVDVKTMRKRGRNNKK